MAEHIQGLVSWIEVHPGTASWVQAVGSIIAIVVAILIPWGIHRREQTAAQSARLAYRTILKDALLDLQTPLGLLSMLGSAPEDEAENRSARRNRAEERQQAVEVASDMEAWLSAMTQAASIIDELETIQGIDSFEVIRSLFHVRRKLREYLPLMEREAGLLREHPTPGVVEVAIDKLKVPTTDLLESVQEALRALQEQHNMRV
jgi:hypothetical protein